MPIEPKIGDRVKGYGKCLQCGKKIVLKESVEWQSSTKCNKCRAKHARFSKLQWGGIRKVGVYAKKRDERIDLCWSYMDSRDSILGHSADKRGRGVLVGNRACA